MAFDYRSELKRPLSLALAGVAILGWLLALGLGLSSSADLSKPKRKQRGCSRLKPPCDDSLTSSSAPEELWRTCRPG